MQSEQPEPFVEELLQKINNRGLRPGDTHPARTMVARMAAISEARGFSVRDRNDWEALAKSLLNCDNPLLDGRGRPTFVEMRNAELTRKLMLDGPLKESDGLDGLG